MSESGPPYALHQIFFGDGIGSYRDLSDGVASAADDISELSLFGWMVGVTHTHRRQPPNRPRLVLHACFGPTHRRAVVIANTLHAPRLPCNFEILIRSHGAAVCRPSEDSVAPWMLSRL
jgi:hypothetical protein